MNKEPLVIFDTTMRDGEQSPGASMTREEKVRIARMLEKMRVDVIEAGFAASSPGDFAAVQAVAREVRDSSVCSLTRARREDIDIASKALQPARAPRIHTFIATSPLHMQRKLCMSPEQVLEAAQDAVKHARNYTDDVEFSCEDASRSERDFLCRVIEATIKAGARTINIPDTVGYGEPGEFGAMLGLLMQAVPNADQALFSVHCHNDLGLAVANSLSAVMHGARQVECTVNGLGERAGNASMEEIVMAVRTRSDIFPVMTRVDTKQIVPASRLVSSITGFPVQPNKAIVGSNAFAHEAGIHQDGVIKHRETYEIMRAEDVGWHSNKLVLGKHSGRNAFRARLQALGATLNEETLQRAFERFKELADRKHEIFDEDLQTLLSEFGSADTEMRLQLEGVEYASLEGGHARAGVRFRQDDGKVQEGNAEGDGPVDAVFRAIEEQARSGAQLLLYSVNAITGGSDSQGEVTVRLGKDERTVNGTGADTDIVVASAKAYLGALERLAWSAARTHPQREGV